MKEKIKEIGKEKKKTISRITKFWIGLGCLVVILCLTIVAFWLCGRALFQDNSRFVLSEIRIEGTPGFWRGSTPGEREDRARELATRLGLKYGETNLFALDPGKLRTKLLSDVPEIEKASVYRVLPDLLVFDVVERIPRATLGKGRLVDENGIVMDQHYCLNLKGSLPFIVSLHRKPVKLRRGDKLQDPNLLLALEFIRMVDLDFPKISISKVVSVNTRDGEYLQCELTYKKDPDSFIVRLPTRISQAKLTRDIPERLISALEEGLKNPNLGRTLTLTFENQVIVTPK